MEDRVKPTYEELLEKLEEVTNILNDRNQDKDYDERLGHILTESSDLIDRAKKGE